ncbi:hypothetical protein [Microvirga flavescens]|uniref:hypothetical protein n=1 Tax=Microvirga flavescens TaxID=2249811 RepID=UPI000DD97E3B|nr:hypothetical protein [Microvirga flavescens]
MRHFSNDHHDWYEDDEPFEVADQRKDRIPGLPFSWPSFGWGLACFAFSAAWILNSLSTLDSASDFGGMSRVAGSLWNLLLAMLLSYLLFRFSRPYLRGLSYVLCGLSATYLLFTHSF